MSFTLPGVRRFVRALVAPALAAMLLVPVPARAQRPAAGAQPPLIDRELFFGDPEITGAQISPDGKYLAFIKPYKGTRNVWVKKTEEPFDAARPVTADTKRPIPAYFFSRDSKAILFVQDQGGDENYNVYAVDPAGAPEAATGVPAARNLTNAKGARAFIYAVPKSAPDVIYVGLNDRDQAWHDLYEVRISTGDRTLLRKNTDRITGWVFDTKDRLRLATRAADNGDTELLRVDDNGFTKVYSCDVLEACGPVRFDKDGRRVYLETNKGGNFTRLVLFDPATGAEELVEQDPEKRVDFDRAIFSDRTDELIATVYLDDKPRYYWKDGTFEADYQWLRKQLQDREVGLGSSSADERLWIVSATGDTEPGTTYLFDRQTRKLARQYSVREKLPRDALAPMTAIRYKSSDGLEIPAYLTLPKGLPSTSLPLLVVPHGGPWGRDAWGYNGIPQFFANRGYAVLQPNFRGSTGYGRSFLDAGNREWGEKMQEDLTWGVKHLVAQGVADPKRVGILGGSYGGYATLAGVAFTPDLYAAAVSIVGPSNLLTLLDSIPPYWEAARKVFYKRMGDPTTPEGKAQLERQSPLSAADRIKTPLLVVQGANDPRVKKAESDQIVVALRDRGFPVEYLVAPDEGHGFARPVNNMAMFATAEKFLAKHLGGRFQESMTPEVAARLQEITVDPKTVQKPSRVQPTSLALPKPVMDLRPRTVTYAARIEMNGQKMTDMTIVSDIRDEGGSWVVTDSMKGPMGEATDRAVLEKGSLVLSKRSIVQGPIAIDYEVKDGRATGQVKAGGDPKPLQVDLGGPLFADGAGSYDVIATLPLAEGYETTFRNLDVQAQKVRPMQVKVVGSEQVTVAAGTFDCYKLVVTSPEDTSKTEAWVRKDDRQVVRMQAVLPRMNGAVLTAELQK